MIICGALRVLFTLVSEREDARRAISTASTSQDFISRLRRLRCFHIGIYFTAICVWRNSRPTQIFVEFITIIVPTAEPIRTALLVVGVTICVHARASGANNMRAQETSCESDCAEHLRKGTMPISTRYYIVGFEHAPASPKPHLVLSQYSAS